MSPTYRCGAYGLPAAETGLIRTLFKLYQHGATDFRWKLVDAPPYDAILVDENAGNEHAIPGYETAKAILKLGSARLAALPNTLARPLRSDKLEAWLLQTQRQFFPETGSGAATSTPPPSLSAASDGAMLNSAKFKLLRWPPAAMLRNDAKLIRMATVLSRRPTSISELAQLSQQPFGQAHTFVMALSSAGLLSATQVMAPSAPSTSVQAAARPAPPQAARKIERSLVSRIRQRLGL